MITKTSPEIDKFVQENPHLFKEINVKSKKVLLREGEKAQKVFFIKKGCLRAWINSEGKEITFQFFFENNLIASIESFLQNKPSPISIETIEPSTLLVLSKNNFEFILNNNPMLKDFLLEMALKRFSHYSRLFISFIKNNPAERYKQLLKDEPMIIRRVPQHYIASYLGITPVSLSRIRSKLR